MAGNVMVMAGGTGGHVFPALAVADELRSRGWSVFWLGTRDSFESRVVPEHGIDMEWIDIKGFRGKGLVSRLMMPLRLLHAMFQAMRVISRRKPCVVLGMGGFVSGPGGLSSRLMGKPLVIQEQNFIPGMTNRWLAKFSSRVFEAFPGSFEQKVKASLSGNPVRKALFEMPAPQQRIVQNDRAVHLLILGGSLGAKALNEMVPAALKLLPEDVELKIKHQAGKHKLETTIENYAGLQTGAEVTEFISDMASAYAWADLVICRSGALTVTELTAVGIGSILVPYPYAVDDHQTSNGQYLVDAKAALMFQESALTPEQLASVLNELLSDHQRLLNMACAANSLAKPDATEVIANACEEVAIC